MSKKFTVLSTLALGLVVSSAYASPFTPGNIVVVRVGDGSAALSSSSTAVFLDEYTTTGAFVQSVAAPTAVSGANRAFTNAGTSTSEGFISRSTDGAYLLLGGYDSAPGTATIAGTLSTNVNRVVARVGLNAVFDTTTALNDSFSGSNIRSVASTDGINLWVGGTASSAASAGVRYTTYGATTALQLSSSPTNIRVVTIQNGQLYISSASGAFQGVSTVGTGLPTQSGQTTTLLPGFPTATGPSTYDYFFADANTLYLADDRTATGGGLQKWTQSGGTWSMVENWTGGLGSVGLRGLTGSVSGGNATLFATSTDGKLVTMTEALTDTSATAAFTVLGTAPTNTAFRGVEFTPVPEPASMAILGIGALALLRRRRK